MVMEKEVFDSYVKAGRIAGTALKYGAGLIKEGVTLLEVTEAVEEKILSLGGEFAFPPQINKNNIAAHYCCPFEDKTAFEDGDIIKIDCGVQINGWIADNARTVVVGNHEKLKLLSEASKAALNSAIKILKPGLKTSAIGRVVEDEIRSRGFKPVINLSGHGVGHYIIHTSPNIPNFEAGGNAVLHEDQAIAIEPFASSGSGMIHEKGEANVFGISGSKPVRSPMTREVLGTINSYKGLPFAKRWLVKAHGPGKTAFALKELKTLGMLREYPPLPDTGLGMVSQHEHTIIVRDKPVVTTLVDED